MVSVSNKKFEALRDLGAADFAHLNDNLLDHLKGTQELLASWSASQALQEAGLYHAAYGTAGFDKHMVSVDQRTKIIELLGPKVEETVYQYCACDRNHFWPQLGLVSKPDFVNRFTGQSYHLNPELLRDFCELTVANELEIASHSPEFIALHGDSLFTLFTNISRLLSSGANKAVARILGQNK